MGLRGTPQKSNFWSQKWNFLDFLFRGSVEGRGGLQFSRKKSSLACDIPKRRRSKHGWTQKDAAARQRDLVSPYPLNSRAPRFGSGPNCPLERPPPSPPLQLKDPSLKPQPFPPKPPLPLPPPTPAGSFAILRDRAAQAGVGEGSWEARGWRTFKNTIIQGVSDTPPPEFRGCMFAP